MAYPMLGYAMMLYPVTKLEVHKFEPLIFILHSIGGGGGITLIDE